MSGNFSDAEVVGQWYEGLPEKKKSAFWPYMRYISGGGDFVIPPAEKSEQKGGEELPIEGTDLVGVTNSSRDVIGVLPRVEPWVPGETATEKELMLFTPRDGVSGERLTLYLSREDYEGSLIWTRTQGYKGQARDANSGKLYYVYGTSCGLTGCNCDSYVVEIEEEANDSN